MQQLKIGIIGSTYNNIPKEKIESVNEKVMCKIIKRLEDFDKQDIETYIILKGKSGIEHNILSTIIPSRYCYNTCIEFAIPFKNQYCIWPADVQSQYLDWIKVADKVTYIESLDDYRIASTPINEFSVAKEKAAERYIIDNADIVVFALTSNDIENHKQIIEYAKSKGKKIESL